METREQLVQRLVSSGAVVVIRLTSTESAVLTGRALAKGGLSAIEISLVTPGALDAIRLLRSQLGKEVMLGAGTVLDPESARMAALAGADFLVSPICNVELVKAAHRYNNVILGGALTPTEILSAWEMGCDLVKVFPADSVGGPSYIKAVLAPLPQLRLAPTGGVDLDNSGPYIRAGAAIVCIGSSLVDKDSVERGDYASITERSELLRQRILEARSS